MSNVSCITSPDEAVESETVPRWQATPRIEVRRQKGVTILDMGKKEIWDGSDLCLLRDTLIDLCRDGCCRAVGIEMRSVKGIPTGFFGLLHDLHIDDRVIVHLLHPQPHVCRMLWFRTFCESDEAGGFVLLRDPKPNVVPGAYHFWASMRGEDFSEVEPEVFEPVAD